MARPVLIFLALTIAALGARAGLAVFRGNGQGLLPEPLPRFGLNLDRGVVYQMTVIENQHARTGLAASIADRRLAR